MPAVTQWGARDAILFDEAAQELFQRLGGEQKVSDGLEEQEPVKYALVRQLLQNGFDGAGLTAMLLAWTHDGELQTIVLAPEDWQRAGARVIWEHGESLRYIAALTFDKHATSKPLAGLFADLEKAWRTRRPLPVLAYLQRHDVEQLRLRLPEPGESAAKLRKPTKAALRNAVQTIAAQYSEGERPGEAALVAVLKKELPGTTRDQARAAFKMHAPRLWGERGRHKRT
jgi:hypothetical protein